MPDSDYYPIVVVHLKQPTVCVSYRCKVFEEVEALCERYKAQIIKATDCDGWLIVVIASYNINNITEL